MQRVRFLGGAKQISLHLFGYESDLLRSELLYTSRLLREAQGRQLSGSGGLAGWRAGQRADLGGSPLSGRPRGRIAG